MEKLSGLSHLFMTVFLHNFSTFMVVPTITDVTMSAICPGEDECSLAIYLTGVQQAILLFTAAVVVGTWVSDMRHQTKGFLTFGPDLPKAYNIHFLLDASARRIIGLGSLVTMPLIGYLSDRYGRKVMLTVPLTLTIFPLAILAYSRAKYFFFAYYVIKTLTSMLCEGSVLCLALAYVADNVPESRRASAFGILSGIVSCSFVCGNLSTRFLSTPSTFQGSSKNARLFKTMPSFNDTLSLLRSSSTFSLAAVVAFFSSLGEVGLYASLLYYLKAQFHFNKDQFADLMVINGIAGTISQMLLMPLLAPIVKEANLLSLGLLFSCAHVSNLLTLCYYMVLRGPPGYFLVSYLATATFLPSVGAFVELSKVSYAAATFSVFAVFAPPCIRSIASKQVGPREQILNSVGDGSLPSNEVRSVPALFLSESAPFHFPGFSIMCAGFVAVRDFVILQEICELNIDKTILLQMIAFVLSIMIRTAPVSDCKVDDSAEP
ncbi:hypothetical protein RJ639_028620 [Escallonia herrerae]|uniref:Uncharacterized protein n=1 Tax=Escallonia herrerae TaxID=1293975 RepID=A0AA88X2W5_9ASTE|nr:hypothetical protein RJ639_028620 [Escallonia herrerae]